MTIAFDATYAASQRTFEKTAAAVESHDLIAVEPSQLFFRNHVPAQIYEQTLHIRNTSAISRRLRLLRPESRYFKVAKVKWPGGESSGVLAPGMSVHCLVTFAPDSLKDFEDRLVVVSEEGVVAATRPRAVDVWHGAARVRRLCTTGRPTALCMRHDLLLVGAGSHGRIEVWADARRAGVLGGHAGAVTGIGIDDQRRVFSASVTR